MANDHYTIDDIFNQFSTAITDTEAPQDGTTYKLLSVWSDLLEDIQQRTDSIRNFNNIDNESGAVLDDEGRNSNVIRNGDADDFYRFRIKMKRLRRGSKGTLPFLYNLISSSLGCSPSDFRIVGMYDQDGQANVIRVEDISADYMNDSRKAAALLTGLQAAVAEGIIVGEVGYQVYSKTSIYMGIVAQFEEEFDVQTTEYTYQNDFHFHAGIGIQSISGYYVSTNKKE